jgi:hypothetical protein
MRVMYERVAGIDVHQDMIKVGIRTPGHRAWTRTSEVLQYRTFYGVLQKIPRTNCGQTIKGPTAVPGDQAPDLHLLGSGGGIWTRDRWVMSSATHVSAVARRLAWPG